MKVSGLRDDYGHEPVTDEDIKESLASEFWGISDGDHGVSKGSEDVEPANDEDDEAE